MSEARRVLRHAPKPHVPFMPEGHTPKPRLGSFTAGNGNYSSSVQSTALEYIQNNNQNHYNNGGTASASPYVSENIIARPINENNSFNIFQQQQQATTYNRQNRSLVPFNYTGIPGVGYQSVELMTRLKFALLSGVASEIRWALTELVSMSKNAPQVVNLKENTFVADHLVEHYKKCPFIDAEKKNQVAYPYMLQNATDDATWMAIENSLDAALALRNLSQDTESAHVLSLNPLVKETAVKVLQCDIIQNELPIGDVYDSATNLLQFTVDIVESVSSYIAPALKDDDLFVTLADFLMKSTDRSVIISILRSLSRLLVRSNLSLKQQYAAENISQSLLDLVCSFLLIQTDPELILTALDFLYQYILPGGVRITNLLKSVSRQNLLVDRLPRLLTYGITFPVKPSEHTLAPLRLVRRVKNPAPEVARVLPDDLYNEINKLEEPLRATVWMRVCFRAVADSDVTQISLWKSYESQFQKEHSIPGGKKLLPAVDFIKNVSNAFPNSAAMVITNPQTNQRKFIIKGIEPRETPVSIEIGNNRAFNVIGGTGSDLLGDRNMPSQQAPVNLAVSNDSKPKTVPEIGNSTSLLLLGLSVHDKGKTILKSMEKDLLLRIDQVPALYEALVDCLIAISTVQ